MDITKIPATHYRVTCEHCGDAFEDVSVRKVEHLLKQHQTLNKKCLTKQGK